MTKAGTRLMRARDLETRVEEIQRLLGRMSEQFRGLAFDVRAEVEAAQSAQELEESRPRPQLAVSR